MPSQELHCLWPASCCCQVTTACKLFGHDHLHTYCNPSMCPACTLLLPGHQCISALRPTSAVHPSVSPQLGFGAPSPLQVEPLSCLRQQASSSLFCLLQVKPVVDITWFTFRLYKLTGRRGMAILYLYSFLGFAILRGVTPDFGALSGKEYFLEGAFRWGSSHRISCLSMCKLPWMSFDGDFACRLLSILAGSRGC